MSSQPRVPRVRAGKQGVRGGKFGPEERPPEARAAVRALFEGEPGQSVASVAAESGLSERTVTRWRVDDAAKGKPWIPAARKIPDLAGRAAQLANTFKVKMSELGKPLTDEVAAEEAANAVTVTHAVNVRAQVLDRHRKEWAAPRGLAYQALQLGAKGEIEKAFNIAKLSKITSETLQIIQVGECRAFGLDHTARGADGGTVVVIERDGEPTPNQMDPPEELASMGQPIITDNVPAAGVMPASSDEDEESF